MTHFGIDSWYGRIKSANALRRYVKNDSVFTCAAMKSAHASRWRLPALGGRNAKVCTIIGIRLGMVVCMYLG